MSDSGRLFGVPGGEELATRCRTGVAFGMYVGNTPRRAADVSGERLPPGSSRDAYRAALDKGRTEKRNAAVHPPEELCSREEMQTSPPRILLTNVKEPE